MQTRRREDYEPADRPVRFYESLLSIVTLLLVLAALYTHFSAAMPAAAASITVLMVVSLWKLLTPPRFSATRGGFVVACLIFIVVLSLHSTL